MKVPILKIPFDRDDTTEICRELTDLLLSGRLAMGQKVREFETKFQQFVGSAYALGTSNGTTALEVIFRSLSDFISQGQNQSQPPDRSQAFGRSQPPGQTQWSVAVPSNTFMASCLAPIAAGFKIILIDCDPVYFQMCPEDLARKIQPTTRAVLLVHNGGFISPDWAQIKSIAEKNNSVLIEDAAHAHGAEIDGRQAGTLGLAGAFSFYPTKVLTTAEGGMVVTSDQKLYEKMSAVRQHGQMVPGSNVHDGFGLNYRPSEIHALLGLRMMAKARWILDQRRRAAAVYDELLKVTPIRAVIPPVGHKPSYYKYMAMLPEKSERKRIKARLKDEFEIALAGEVYAFPGNEQPFWSFHPEYLAQRLGEFPNTAYCAKYQICLPIWPGLTREAQEYVVWALLKVI